MASLPPPPPPAAGAFARRLRARAAQTERALEHLLCAQTGAEAWPPRLAAAMRYGALSGGKRLRPFLLMESAAMLSADLPPPARARAADWAESAAAALELVHCYSLMHDDLPAMDNDDMRRGRPAAHKAYDEATALLAGNALLTHAFGALAALPAAAEPLKLCSLLARAAGAGGMIGGQMLDIEAEGKSLSAEQIKRLEMMKTGALLRFACAAGAHLAQAAGGRRAEAAEKAMAEYGAAIGFAFQLADDILDIEGSAQALGKTPGKDHRCGKATFAALCGLAEAKALLAQTAARAQAALAPFGGKAAVLAQAAQFIAARDS